jgi:uncharacterized protein involved in exopolysaccharide biosynthesis
MTDDQIATIVAKAINQVTEALEARIAASDARSIALEARVAALEAEIDLMNVSTPQYRALRRHFPPLEETPK